MINQFVVGGLYKYKWETNNNHINPDTVWILHGVDTYGIEVYPFKQTFVILELDLELDNNNEKDKVIHSIKVLTNDGKIGRLYMTYNDWEQIA